MIQLTNTDGATCYVAPAAVSAIVATGGKTFRVYLTGSHAIDVPEPAADVRKRVSPTKAKKE